MRYSFWTRALILEADHQRRWDKFARDCQLKIFELKVWLALMERRAHAHMAYRRPRYISLNTIHINIKLIRVWIFLKSKVPSVAQLHWEPHILFFLWISYFGSQCCTVPLGTNKIVLQTGMVIAIPCTEQKRNKMRKMAYNKCIAKAIGKILSRWKPTPPRCAF